jgi:ribokinase
MKSSQARIQIHAAVRAAEHPRVVVLIDPSGQRTIVVTASPLQPAASDPLPWSILDRCDAVYFTGADPESLRLARAARCLMVTSRRNTVLKAAQIRPDIIIGSCADPRENAPFATYDPSPAALVLTDGPRPIRIFSAAGTEAIEPPPAPAQTVGDYGAGDSFAGALTYFVAHGLPIAEACRRAGPYGRAVLRGIDPTEQQLALTAP